MKSKWIVTGSMAVVVTMLLALALTLGPAQAQKPAPQGEAAIQTAVGTAFTYQGRLTDDGSPADGVYDLEFRLYDAVSDGLQMSTPVTLENTIVSDGLFTAQLDFDDVFDGRALWLQVSVRPGDSTDSYTTLSPRQPLTAAPYAFGLRPGAIISGSVSGGALTVVNSEKSKFNTALNGVIYSSQGVGVRGYAEAESGVTIAVQGVNASTEGYGVAGLTTATSGNAVGVYGRSDSSGGLGGFFVNETANGIALYAEGNSAGLLASAEAVNGLTYGVRGGTGSSEGYGGYFINSGDNGIALYAEGSGAGRSRATLQVKNTETDAGMAANLTNASNFHNTHIQNTGSGGILYLQNGGTGADGAGGGDFITAFNTDTTDLQFSVASNGDVRSDGSFNTPAADFAEMLPAVDGLEPGEVLVIGLDGKLTRSTQAHQRTVVGVYSTEPGFVGGAAMDGDTTGQVPLAVVGVVPVKVSAENGSILPGDMLVASDTPGHAMRADDDAPNGSVIGKALEGLDEGTGVILMLVMLQ